MDISTATIDRLQELCKSKGITLNKLCTISAVPQSTVSDVVNGATKSMKLVTLKKLCDGLDMSIAEFFNTDVFWNLEQEIK